MILKRCILCMAAPIMLCAAPIQPDVISLFNYQSLAAVDLLPSYGWFGGFVFPSIPSVNVATGLVYLPMGGGGRLTANPIAAQSIHAQASVDFTIAQGYQVFRVDVLGQVMDDGTSVSEGFSVTAPCSAYILMGCVIPAGVTSGTITAWMDMRSENWGHATGTVKYPQVVLAIREIHNPEPVMMILIGSGLIGIWAVGKRRA